MIQISAGVAEEIRCSFVVLNLYTGREGVVKPVKPTRFRGDALFFFFFDQDKMNFFYKKNNKMNFFKNYFFF